MYINLSTIVLSLYIPVFQSILYLHLQKVLLEAHPDFWTHPLPLTHPGEFRIIFTIFGALPQRSLTVNSSLKKKNNFHWFLITLDQVILVTWKSWRGPRRVNEHSSCFCTRKAHRGKAPIEISRQDKDFTNIKISQHRKPKKLINYYIIWLLHKVVIFWFVYPFTILQGYFSFKFQSCDCFRIFYNHPSPIS